MFTQEGHPIILFPKEVTDSYEEEGLCLLREFIFLCDPLWLSRQDQESFQLGLCRELDFLIGGMPTADRYKEYIKANLEELYNSALAKHGL